MGMGFVLEMGPPGSDGGLEWLKWTKMTEYQPECPIASIGQALPSSQPGQLSSV